MGVVAGVDGRAGPAGLLPPRPRRQHVAHLAVEVGEGRQSIKEQVPDAFDGVPAEDRRTGGTVPIQGGRVGHKNTVA